MHYAAGEGHMDAIQALVEKGYCDDTLKTFQGLTMLHIAVTEQKLDVVKYLLQRKPHLAAIPDNDQMLPIQYAKAVEDKTLLSKEIIQLLQVRLFLRIHFSH